ncbi:MAG: ABC transporter permease [Clostridiales bacterium]|nr:ABC transporter permease [Clostridiales bacterium]MBP3809901.1 ABC transporter permease [Clostridiales bacterium]
MNKLKEIYEYRLMVYSLVKRDLRGKYKGSVLGFMWTFVNPLLQLLVYNMVFSIIMRAGVEKFYLYLFVGLIPWLFFSAAITGGSTCIIAQKDLIKKIRFPREIIPISFVTSQFVNMLLSFIVVIIVSVVSGVKLTVGGILCLPVIMLVEYMMALGIALISSSLTVYFRDLEHILAIVAMAWLYATPICYPETMVPEKYLSLYRLNPVTPVVNAYRDVLYYGKTPDLTTLLLAAGIGLITILLGVLIFGKLQRRFAEEL